MNLLLHKAVGELIAGLALRTSGCNPTAVMWDLWWAKRQWNKFFSVYA